jgi:uncharacterized protein YyaL (SSP411 family)
MEGLMVEFKKRLLLVTLWMIAGPVWTAPVLVNQLTNHPSPYLALHGTDPVAWQDWNAQATRMAREQGKLLYMSIGYFSCHWCHVMQRESYKNPKIAELLNNNFIPVKVDRELQPALDAQMIDFVEATQGRGGWPLNVFLTPRGDPLYAVLYLPPANFEDLLIRLNQLWQQDPQRLADVARREAGGGKGPGAPRLSPQQVTEYTQTLVSVALQRADDIHGGFGTQNKFPSVPQLQFLLNQYTRKPDDNIREILELTLDQMAAHGLVDHIGGGFFRYTVDPDWETPHFEKMLYDNALLAGLYLRAAVALSRNDYLAVARKTLDFMVREMTDVSGALYASFSAVDDQDLEGGYYLWDDEELLRILSDTEYAVAKRAWRMSDAPPFEHGYLPMGDVDVMSIAKELDQDEEDITVTLQSARQKLKAIREKRGLPVDTKLLAGWNGLALSSFAEAARLLNEPSYRDAARRIKDYLVANLWDGRSLRRAVSKEGAIGQVVLADYAYVAEGLLAWSELTQDDNDLRLATDVINEAWRRFYRRGWILAEDSLIAQPASQDALMDGPMPAPSGVLAKVSLAVAQRTQDMQLRNQALSALNSGHDQIARNPFWFASHIDAMNTAQRTVVKK